MELTSIFSSFKLSFVLSLKEVGTVQQINIHEAKTNLSRLIAKAVNGEPFIIAKSGKPMVTVTPYSPPLDPQKRVGFLKGSLEIPDDFDSIGKEEIEAMFEG
jgi:prevent-host-death family protein